MTTRKQAGYIAAGISLASLLMLEFWPEATTYHEIFAFPWFYGGFALLSICGSIIAGRYLSPRWYYVAMLWAVMALGLAFVAWY